MITQVIQLIKEEQRKLADGTMQHPDLATYERRVGKYQGLQEALAIIDEVLKGNEED